MPASRGAVLLEVVLALALFVMGAGVIIGGMSSSVQAVRFMKLDARANDMAISLLSEIQMGLVAAVDEGPSPYADDPSLADWSWQVAVLPLDGQAGEAGLQRLEVTVRHLREPVVRRLTQLIVPEEANALGDPFAPPPLGLEGGEVP